ncbi:hypothetical protein GGI16_008898, partial [Coemansia sp. S142-1]
VARSRKPTPCRRSVLWIHVSRCLPERIYSTTRSKLSLKVNRGSVYAHVHSRYLGKHHILPVGAHFPKAHLRVSQKVRIVAVGRLWHDLARTS